MLLVDWSSSLEFCGRMVLVMMSLICWGSSMERWLRLQFTLEYTSLMVMVASALVRGPWIMFLMLDKWGIQLSLINLGLFPLFTPQVIPLEQSAHPLVMLFQVFDLGNPFLLWYLVSRVCPQRLLGFIKSLQVRLAWRDLFLSSHLCRPKPPAFLGLVRTFHLRRWSFIVAALLPQAKSFLNLVNAIIDLVRKLDIMHDMIWDTTKDGFGKDFPTFHVEEFDFPTGQSIIHIVHNKLEVTFLGFWWKMA